jgi:hypothetical protein
MSTRTAINPTSWSINLGFDQAELVEGHKRLLVRGRLTHDLHDLLTSWSRRP